MFARFFALLIAIIALATTLTGCGGGGMNANEGMPVTCDDDNSCTPPPDPPCPFPNGAAPQLIYPAPGSTAIPTNLSEVVVADTSTNGYFRPTTSSPLYSVTFGRQSTGITDADTPLRDLLGFSQITSAQVPQPSATPLATNTVLEASTRVSDITFQPLLPSTTYFVYFFMFPIDLSQPACDYSGIAGSFTTSSIVVPTARTPRP